jgi:hypothetical protein
VQGIAQRFAPFPHVSDLNSGGGFPTLALSFPLASFPISLSLPSERLSQGVREVIFNGVFSGLVIPQQGSRC